MIDEKAAKYAEQNTGKDDNLLKIYEAYQDGYREGIYKSKPPYEVIFYMGMGALCAIALLAVIEVAGFKIFAH